MPVNRPARPETISRHLADPPRALTPMVQLPNWVCWRWTWNGRKWDKPLFRVDQPDRHAKSNDPTTWGSHRDAVSAVVGGKAHGRGFVLTETAFAAIDLDRCRDLQTGVTQPWALDILNQAAHAYCEITASGTGYRIIGTAKGASISTTLPIEEGQVEIYRRAVRYITVSGAEISHCKDLPNIDSLIDAIIAQHRPKEEVHEAPQPQREAHDDEERIRAALNYVDPCPRDVWRDVGMALKSHLGESGRSLWDDWSLRCADKFNERDQTKNWKSFKRNGRIGVGTLFHYAKQGGWRSEKRRENGRGGEGDYGHEKNNGTEQAQPKRKAVLVRADQIKPKSIDWGWKNRFAFGKMNIIAGDPGEGKSTVIVDVVALHSKQGDFPLGEGKAIACETVYLTAEDGLADTLVPRLMAAEADMTKIHFLTGTRIEGASSDADAMFDIQKDVATLRDVFETNPKIRILVIDPITAYLGAGTKAKENTEVRRVLTPLVKLIEDFGVMLIANNHLNKGGGKALYRVLDSIAFTAIGRTLHIVAADAENYDLKKFICGKTNIGSKPKGLTYILQKVWITGEAGEQIETTNIGWGTQYIDETADEALATVTVKDEATTAEEAEDFLRLVLSKGRVKIKDIEQQAREAALLGDDQELRQSKPFRTAKTKLKVIFSRDGFGPGSPCFWSLPPAQPTETDSTIGAPIGAMNPIPKSEGAYGVEGTYGDEESSDSTLHRCPESHTCPQNVSKEMGTYEGTYEPGQVSTNGHAPINSDPECRHEPGPIAYCRVTISEIRHPAISAGPTDDLADFH